MKKINTHRVELPDGRLMTIEGGNAETVAQLVTQKTGGRSSIVQNETPLAMPAMNFTPPAKPAKQPAQVVQNGEEPLVMPALSF